MRKAIDELAALVGYVINNLNGHHIVVTADHGFLFTESAPGEPEKSKLDEKPEGTVMAKKRYLIGHDLPDHEAAWHGKTAVTAGAEGDMEFWIPRGANRFHFTGGARFVHGGAMLQEVVVPSITVEQIEGKSAKETKTKPVDGPRPGHEPQDHDEPAPLRVDPDGAGERAGEGRDAEGGRLRGRRAGHERRDRDLRQRFGEHGRAEEVGVAWCCRTGPTIRRRRYRLVLRDAETGIEQQSVPVVIDRAFHDDF